MILYKIYNYFNIKLEYKIIIELKLNKYKKSKNY